MAKFRAYILCNTKAIDKFIILKHEWQKNICGTSIHEHLKDDKFKHPCKQLYYSGTKSVLYSEALTHSQSGKT